MGVARCLYLGSLINFLFKIYYSIIRAGLSRRGTSLRAPPSAARSLTQRIIACCAVKNLQHSPFYLPVMFMDICYQVKKPLRPTQSTLLISRRYLEEIKFVRSLSGKNLTGYLSRLMNDPDLAWKIKFLQSRKWKKQYQKGGQDLQKVFFYPEEDDWARLSALSNGTGFSRCYVFVFLMLVDLGLIQLPTKNRTQKNIGEIGVKLGITCNIFLEKGHEILFRTLKIPPENQIRPEA